MKTTLLNDRSIVNTFAGSSQRGAGEYQRKPRFGAPVRAGSYASLKQALQGPSFREILERELGSGVGQSTSGRSEALKANAESRAEAETTRFLAGYWA